MIGKKLAGRMTRLWTRRGKPLALWFRWLALALCLLWLAPVGYAQTLSQTEVQKLLASDGAEFDRFGRSVAISGDRALIGAFGDDDAGNVSGSAYVYERNGTGTWVEVAKLNASDAAENDLFGLSVALSGDRALVGAHGDDHAGRYSGSVYVFERDGAGSWLEVAKLIASDAGAVDHFGWSVALSGNRALVGAHGDDHAGNRSGAAYLYERDGVGTWVEVAKLIGSGARELDHFGWSVSLSGDRAVVGAYWGGYFDGYIHTGLAYVFERDATGTWVEVVRLTASDAESLGYFGSSVSLSGDRALIGARNADNGAVGNDAGAAYVFERDGTGAWAEVAKLTPLDAQTRDYFGESVSLSGDRALIGAIGDNRGYPGAVLKDLGAAYLFERDETGTWGEVAKFIASDAAAEDNLGVSVSLSGDRVLIGAEGDDDAGNFTGSAYVLDVPSVSDLDEDGVVGAEDNCPTDMNPLQENFDGDLQGDACDLDDDNDGIDDTSDAFPLDPTLPGGGGLSLLILDSVDLNRYGFRFEDVNSHRAILERNFEASDSSDLTLTLTGYDIDAGREVRVSVNGTSIGFLSTTPNNGRGVTELTIARSLLGSSTSNTLRFEQLNPGWIWGVTDLLLSQSGT